MSNPTFSVVIPLYNKEPHIKRAIDSVLKQSVQDFEIVVVDDGSFDNGADVVRGIKDSRIRLFQQKNAGVSAARNRGINDAKGTMIAFLDADDEWNPDFLKIITRLREKHPEAGLYATAYEILESTGVRRTPDFKAIPLPPWEGILPSYFISGTIGHGPVWTSASCIPKDIFAKVGMFPVGERLGEDLDVWGRIALKYPVAFSWRVGAIYYQNAVNRVCGIRIIDRDLPIVRTLKTLIERGDVPEYLVGEVKEYIAKLQIETIKQNIILPKNWTGVFSG